MEKPALLPEELSSYCDAEEGGLFQRLLRYPPDLIHFFEWAADDETWSQSHEPFMRQAMEWLTDRFIEDKLDIALAKRAAAAIQIHSVILEAWLPKNITFSVKEKQFQENSLLFEASSLFFHELIRKRHEEAPQEPIKLAAAPDQFLIVQEHVVTGTVLNLWRLSEQELIALMEIAFGWGLDELANDCQHVLKRYLTADNVLATLLKAHEKGWGRLKVAAIEFFNARDMGVLFHDIGERFIAFEFLAFTEKQLEVFFQVNHKITHLICREHLTEEPVFARVVNECPALYELNISGSQAFSEFLQQVPKTLKALDLSSCLWLTNQHLGTLLGWFSELESLTLRSNPQITYAGWGALKRLGQLHILDISRSPDLSDEDFHIILQSAPHVVELHIEECKALRDRAFVEIARALPALTSLYLARCSISDTALVDFVAKCPSLLTLDVTRCENLTEKGIIEAVRNTTNLLELNVARCNLPPHVIERIKELRPFITLWS